MKGFSDKVKGNLPEPNLITAARRNLNLPEFAKYLQKKHIPLAHRKGFIDFLDGFLLDFGKGMAYVHWKYGAVNPAIGFNASQVNYFDANEKNFRSDKFPETSNVTFRLGKGRDAIKETYEIFSLTDHRDSQRNELILPLKTLYDVYRNPAIMDGYAESVLGRKTGADLRSLFIAIGAHEAFHWHDARTNPDFEEEMKSYPPQNKDGNESDDYLEHIVEVRAQKAAHEAIAHYGRAQSLRM